MLDRPLKPGQVGRTETQLLWASMYVNTMIRGDDSVDYLAGAVGRSVIDHKTFEPLVLCEDRLDEAADILALVIGRNNDERSNVRHGRFVLRSHHWRTAHAGAIRRRRVPARGDDRPRYRRQAPRRRSAVRGTSAASPSRMPDRRS